MCQTPLNCSCGCGFGCFALTLNWSRLVLASQPCLNISLTLLWPSLDLASTLPWHCLDPALTLPWLWFYLALTFHWWTFLDLALNLPWPCPDLAPTESPKIVAHFKMSQTLLHMKMIFLCSRIWDTNKLDWLKYVQNLLSIISKGERSML